LPASSRKIVIDSSALISLAHGSVLEIVLKEFQIITSSVVWRELEATAKFDDPDGRAAHHVLAHRELLTIVDLSESDFAQYLGRRVHGGEASCVALARHADAFICDDFDALPYLEAHCRKLGIEIGLCSVLIHALVIRGRLSKEKPVEYLTGSQSAVAGWGARCTSMGRNCWSDIASVPAPRYRDARAEDLTVFLQPSIPISSRRNSLISSRS
jgi:predicted nucleic acid-binding protein